MTAPSKPRLVVTRPAREAAQWVAQLRAHGFAASALPLIDIAPAPDPLALATAWQHIARYQAVMFVSAHAVTHFFAAAQPHQAAAWCAGAGAPRAWVTGPGTQAALEAIREAAGLPMVAIDAPPSHAPQFDSEALWAQVSHQIQTAAGSASPRVLIVRGAGADGQANGRDWLAQQLLASGAVVDTVLAYRRLPPQFDAQQRALANQAAADGSVWLFSSSEAIHNLQAQLPQQSWSQARALVTHPRIAQAAQQAGFAVLGPIRPGLAELLASIESLA